MTMTTLDVLRIYGPCDARAVCRHVPGTPGDIRAHFAILAGQGLALPNAAGLWDVTVAGGHQFDRNHGIVRGPSDDVVSDDGSGRLLPWFHRR